MHNFPLNQALVEFEDELPNIRKACLENADSVIAQYSPYQELDVDQPITKEAIHFHINFLQVEEKLTPILNSIKRIDSYRYFKQNPNKSEALTDMEIQQAREADADWFIQQANLSTKRPHYGICPFHADNNASLMLMKSKVKGTLYLKCFPCGTVVDSIGYIMKRDNLNFPQAVRAVNL